MQGTILLLQFKHLNYNFVSHLMQIKNVSYSRISTLVQITAWIVIVHAKEDGSGLFWLPQQMLLWMLSHWDFVFRMWLYEQTMFESSKNPDK